jgi:nitrate/nitrite transport system permease protein
VACGHAARTRGSQHGAQLTPEQLEYAKLMGKDPAQSSSPSEKSGFPTLAQMGGTFVDQLSNPL